MSNLTATGVVEPLIERRCRACGEPFRSPRPRAGFPSLFCERHRQRRICSTCGGEFRTSRRGGGITWRYCSMECRPKAKITKCVVCQSEITYSAAAGRTPYWCSLACKLADQRKRYAEGRSRFCKCGVELAWGGYRKACDDCRDKARESMRRRGCHFRKRARYHGVPYESIRPMKVYARDKWRCGICGRRVNPKVKWPNKMCASLDHIIPMSKGGGHVWGNVQCSHFRCNSIKQDTI